MFPFFLFQIIVYLSMKNFFEKFPSPYPFDVKERISKGYREPYDLSNELRLIYPEKLKKSFKVNEALVVGCGHTEGIYHALRNPDVNFTCIDISNKAIKHSSNEAKRLNLENCNFINIDFCDFTSNFNFDIIYCRNVLQFLPTVLESLNKCSSMLNNNGALICTIPSSYLYDDINHLREIIIKLGYSYNNIKDVEEAKNLVTGLMGAHPSKLRAFNNDKVIDDNDFISRFMIPENKCYDIYSLFSLIKSSNLYFQSWYNNALYYPSALLRKDSNKHKTFYKRIDSLDNIDKWHSVCTIFRSSLNRFSHTFCLRKNQQFEFIDSKLLTDNSSIVSVRPYQVIKKNDRQEYHVGNSNYLKKLTENEYIFLQNIEKPKSLEKIFNLSINNIDNSDKKAILVSLYESSVIYLYN